jgi:hypothetical protein
MTANYFILGLQAAKTQNPDLRMMLYGPTVLHGVSVFARLR